VRTAETHETPAAAREAMSLYAGALDAASGVAAMLQDTQFEGSGESIIVRVSPANTPEDIVNIMAVLTKLRSQYVSQHVSEQGSQCAAIIRSQCRSLAITIRESVHASLIAAVRPPLLIAFLSPILGVVP